MENNEKRSMLLKQSDSKNDKKKTMDTHERILDRVFRLIAMVLWTVFAVPALAASFGPVGVGLGLGIGRRVWTTRPK